jgi:hypothetical protein
MALQPDGKIVLALVPVTDVATEQPRISPLVIRLQSDGTRDENFYPGEGVLLEEIDEAEAQKVAFHQDGTLLVGGQFFTVNGVSRVCLARLHGTSVETLVIPPKPRLRISIQDGEVAVHWQRVFGPCGVLEEAERIEGPWKPVVNPVDPFVVAPAAAAGFYRIIESASP